MVSMHSSYQISEEKINEDIHIFLHIINTLGKLAIFLLFYLHQAPS